MRIYSQAKNNLKMAKNIIHYALMKNKKDFSDFVHRKQEHIALALKQENEARGGSGLQCISLMHSALPEMDLSEVDISTKLFDQELKTPFVVTGMTGGWKGALAINRRIARLAEKRGWVMGVGSQRGQLWSAKAGREWEKIRRSAPHLTLLGNIGLSQLIHLKLSLVEDLLLSLSAEALVVHTNPLQEALQVEGTPRFKGGLKALRRLCRNLSVPVILKETGCGFSKETLKALVGAGLFAVDVSGYGGTHWGRIEGDRTPEEHALKGVADSFKYWGVPTLDSLLFAGEIKKDYKIWASGGLRGGVDFAKALALGADRVGLAGPIMAEALKGTEVLDRFMSRMEYELKVAMFCTASRDLKDLKRPGVWKWNHKPHGPGP